METLLVVETRAVVGAEANVFFDVQYAVQAWQKDED